jgi:hypothetical protein
VDVVIGTLNVECVAVGDRHAPSDRTITAAFAGPDGRSRFEAAFSTSFPGDGVVCIRELEVASTVALDPRQLDTVLARAVATAAVRTVIDHERDDDVVVRFDNMACFVAHFIHDRVEGRRSRWWFQPLATYERPNGTVDWVSLLADHQDARWEIFVALQRLGSLNRFLQTVEPTVLATVLDDLAASDKESWVTLLRNGAADSALIDNAAESLGGLAECLMSRHAPADWNSFESVAAGSEIASRELEARSPAQDSGSTASGSAEHRMQTGVEPELDRPTIQSTVGASADQLISPRTREILATVTGLATAHDLNLELTIDSSGTDLICLVTTLTQYDKRFQADDHVISVCRHVLARAAALDSPANDNNDPVARAAIALAQKQPALTQAQPDDSRSPLGATLLALRGLTSIGLSTSLLSRVPGSGTPLVLAILHRVAGTTVDHHPLSALFERLAATDDADVTAIQTTADARLTSQRAFGERRHRTTVPWGTGRQLAIVHDEFGRLVSASDDAASHDARPSLTSWQAAFSDAFTSIESGHDPTVPEDTELALDLLTISVLGAWARWLPGFENSTIPFLLSTFLRRSSSVTIGDDLVTVDLEPGTHDVVLNLAGYLEPFDAGPLLGGRHLRFVVGSPR